MKWNALSSFVLVAVLSAPNAFSNPNPGALRAPSLGSQSVTAAEAGAMNVVSRLTTRVPSLGRVADALRAQNSAGQLNLTSPKMAAAAVIALAGTIPGYDADRLTAEIAAEVNAPAAKIVVQAPTQTAEESSLAFMSTLGADASNCGLAMGKAPVSSDISPDQQIIITEAESAINNFVAFGQFYGLNNAQLQESVFSLVNSAALEGSSIDFDVAAGLGSLYSFSIPATAEAIAKLSADGDFSDADKELTETCGVFWSVNTLAASKGMPASDGQALAAEVGGACAVPLTGKPAPSSFASCNI